jgi:hypothetical protein
MFIRTERREYRSSSWLMKRAELAACGWYAVPAAAARRSRQAGSWPSTQVYDIDREPDVRVDGIREGWPAREHDPLIPVEAGQVLLSDVVLALTRLEPHQIQPMLVGQAVGPPPRTRP